jgi:hypothetical protein
MASSNLPVDAQPGLSKTKRQQMLPFDCIRQDCLRGGFGAGLAIFLAEFFNTAGSVYNLLRAGIKRVALGTDFDVQRFRQSGFGFERVAATAGHGNFFILRMSVSFHVFSLAIMRGEYAQGGELSMKAVNLATPPHPVPFFALALAKKIGARQGRSISVVGGMVRQITLVSIVAAELAYGAPATPQHVA